MVQQRIIAGPRKPDIGPMLIGGNSERRTSVKFTTKTIRTYQGESTLIYHHTVVADKFERRNIDGCEHFIFEGYTIPDKVPFKCDYNITDDDGLFELFIIKNNGQLDLFP